MSDKEYGGVLVEQSVAPVDRFLLLQNYTRRLREILRTTVPLLDHALSCPHRKYSADDGFCTCQVVRVRDKITAILSEIPPV